LYCSVATTDNPERITITEATATIGRQFFSANGFSASSVFGNYKPLVAVVFDSPEKMVVSDR
jgi:hypothetical protein